ncbi:MAG: hypothetical protein EOP24_00895 [Hyphomicrobiales bacterium]|nr:MAG: hypothetical protein EOP24_00895 [Hyphomicrobiales bacterium]
MLKILPNIAQGSASAPDPGTQRLAWRTCQLCMDQPAFDLSVAKSELVAAYFCGIRSPRSVGARQAGTDERPPVPARKDDST